MSIECLRLYSDASGESHFSTTTIELSSVEFAPPAPPLEVSGLTPAIHGFLRASTGWYGDWHPAPKRQMMCLLSGSLRLETSDGQSRLLQPGAIVLLEDTEGTGHTTRVVSDVPATMVFAQLE